MADTAIAITAGSGTNVDTRTEATNGNHRQVVVLGDPSINAGVAAVDATNGLSVNVTNASLTVGSHAVTNAGTFATQSAITAASGSIAAGAIAAGATSIADNEDVASADGDRGVKILAVRKASPANTSGTDGDYEFLQMSAGRLWTDSNIKIAGTAPTVGAGASDAGTLRVTVDSGQLSALGATTASGSISVVPATDSVLITSIKVDDAAFTPGTTPVQMIGLQADESSTDSVDEGDAGCPRMTLDRKVIVTPQPHTTAGLSIFRSLDIDETEEDVKTSAGQVYGMWVTNTATSTRFVKFFNATAANVTVGSTTPVITIGIPGNTSDDVSGLFSTTMGITFDTAISVAATTGAADNDSGAPGANEVIINVFYK